MKCRNCGMENPEEARFCMNCSVRLRPLVCLEKDPLPPAFLECEPLPEDEAFLRSLLTRFRRTTTRIYPRSLMRRRQK